MKFLSNLWPWKRFEAYETELTHLRKSLDKALADRRFEEAKHAATRNALDERHKHIRKMASIIAIKGGITVLFLFFCISGFGQAWQRNNVTTNLLSAAPADGWFIGSTSSVPVWTINGRALTNLNLSLATNNDLAVSNVIWSMINSITNTFVANNLDTNAVGTAAADGWFIISSNSVPKWSINGSSLTNISHGTQTIYGGVNAQSVNTGATNHYFVSGTAGGASTFINSPVGIDGNIIEFRASYSGTIFPTTNVNFEIFTNDFTQNVAAKTTGFQASIAAGTHSISSTNVIPIRAGYGWSVGVWSSQGNGLASSQYSWCIRVQW